MPRTFFLVPGYGAQGGTAKDLRGCFDKDGLGAIINSSRGIIAAYKDEKYKYKFSEEEFGYAARESVINMKEDLLKVRS
jgi:orotidine-5'-phosphate decarboxylase